MVRTPEHSSSSTFFARTFDRVKSAFSSPKAGIENPDFSLDITSSTPDHLHLTELPFDEKTTQWLDAELQKHDTTLGAFQLEIAELQQSLPPDVLRSLTDTLQELGSGVRGASLSTELRPYLSRKFGAVLLVLALTGCVFADGSPVQANSLESPQSSAQSELMENSPTDLEQTLPTTTPTPRVTPSPTAEPTPKSTTTPEVVPETEARVISVTIAVPISEEGANVRKKADLQSDRLTTIPLNGREATLTGEKAVDDDGYTWFAVASMQPDVKWKFGWMRKDTFEEVAGTITVTDAAANTGGPVETVKETEGATTEASSGQSVSAEFSFFPDAEYTKIVTVTLAIFAEPVSVHKQPSETSDIVGEQSWFIINETPAGPIKNGDFIQVKLQNVDAAGKYTFAAGWVKTDDQTQISPNQVVELAQNASEVEVDAEDEVGILTEVTIMAADNDPLLKNLSINQEKFDAFITEMIVSYLHAAGPRITDAEVKWSDPAAIKTWLATNPEVTLPFLTRYYDADYAEWSAVEREDLPVHIGNIEFSTASADVWNQYVTWWNSGKDSSNYPNDQVEAFAEQVNMTDPRNFVNQGNNAVPGAFSQRTAVLSIIDADGNLRVIQAIDTSRMGADDPRITAAFFELIFNMLAAQLVSATYDETPQNEGWSYSNNTSQAFGFYERFWRNGTIATSTSD